MKIALFEVEDWERGAFAELEADHEVLFHHQALDEDTVGDAADADVISTFIYSKLKQSVLDQCENLKLITTRFDHVDIDYCKERNISFADATGLDVLPEEPAVREEAEVLRSYFQKEHNLDTLLANQMLLRMKNVIIMPHSAFNTREAVQRILDTTHENIVAFARGKAVNIWTEASAEGNDI